MKSYHFESTPLARPEVIVQGPHYRFTLLTDRLLRYEWAYDGKFEDRASTFAINRDFPVPKFQTIDHPDELEIITDHFHLSYDKKRFNPSGLLCSFSAKVTLWGAQWRYGEENDRRENLGGTARTLDECDGRCDMGTGVLSRFGYADVDDSKSMLFDGKGFVAGRLPGDRIDGYLFCHGHDYKGAIKDFYALSGKQPILPRWALGNWWSRYYKYHQDEYIKLMDEFRKKEVPLSVAVVDMDWHLVDDERVPHAGWTGYTWDDKLFPDPETFGRELHRRHLKITLNDHPHAGIHHHEDAYEEMARFLGHDTSKRNPILFDPTSPKFMEAYLTILHRNIEKIADFWWVDWQQGTHTKVPGIDPLWLLNHFHFLDSAHDGKRPLIFSRYAGPGSHRYPVGFSGDTVTTWASLAFQPEFTATASNIGYGWWSHDIGGHYGGARDDELVTRWVQFGVFSPIMRLHSSNSRWSSKEPWLYRKENETIIEKFMRLRHRLIPYLHTCNVLGSIEDEPLIQPMYWHFPKREEAYQVPNQYFFGSELVVAPIVTPKDKRTNLGRVKVWLPPSGRHVDIFTGTVYDGDRELNMYRALDQIPVLAGEGSIIPLDANPVPENGGPNPKHFEVLVVVGRDGKFNVIEDLADDWEVNKSEGIEAAAVTAAPATTGDQQRSTQIEYKQQPGELTVRASSARDWTFRFLAITEIPQNLKVMVDGHDRTSDAVVTIETYPATPSVVVHVPKQDTEKENEKSALTISLGSDPQLSVLDHKARFERLLLDYQTEFDIKDRIWGIVNDRRSAINVKIGKLLSLSVDETLTEPVAELILSDVRGMQL
ncbi:hypothetical protein HRR83_004925 [Exophiala dermatitidis]|uniref:alpha-glucosidase n=2 Tax=Exophiala dermatitidis TaxID=5970 RepID=H6C3K1_EXODN|nr:glycosyl hydrolase, family protein 31 [Exophiala dermatitidis NIH/UT8656]KAJ4517160.1 hypothetical protein HRR74_004910 [Exophiala dermatitidis]EHY58216.1 glycosyl hydrolase, family protein 31 [Exophiala dermatitidis NIH/UT8656]KAJ4519662.1 hypothetical protein HRR73_003722 [Exophiala dermatitidis]KAJ4534538.1 hypothetical protein HRR76_006460 [Exophiala dermatitidis]KAJ4551119.1 hypothetical protein HRR77_003463 [Exophiala dermatitidis]